MHGTGAIGELQGGMHRRARAKGRLRLAADLMVPALLIGLLRVWSLTTAPKQSLYFTAEALLIAYAYFAAVRVTMIHSQGRDWEGRYDRRWALKARLGFYHTLGVYRFRIGLVLAPFLGSALLLDVLTADTGFQFRPNVHLSILFVALMVWARYGAAVVIAAARWSPPKPARFSEARALASRPPVARSFALVNLGFGAVAVTAVLAYKSAGALLPTARAELVCLIVLFTGLAWFALWLHCRWSAAMLVRIGELPVVTTVPARTGKTMSEPVCPETEPRAAPYMVAPICHGTNSLSP